MARRQSQATYRAVWSIPSGSKKPHYSFYIYELSAEVRRSDGRVKLTLSFGYTKTEEQKAIQEMMDQLQPSFLSLRVDFKLSGTPMQDFCGQRYFFFCTRINGLKIRGDKDAHKFLSELTQFLGWPPITSYDINREYEIMTRGSGGRCWVSEGWLLAQHERISQVAVTHQ